MNTTQDLLDGLRAKAGSDRKAAALIGNSQQSFSAWRRGYAYPDDEHARAIAAALNLDAAHVLAIIHCDRAKSDETRALWQRIAATFAKAAGVAAVAMGAGLVAPQPASAGFNKTPFSVQSGPEIHIVSRRRRSRQGGFCSPWVPLVGWVAACLPARNKVAW